MISKHQKICAERRYCSLLELGSSKIETKQNKHKLSRSGHANQTLNLNHLRCNLVVYLSLSTLKNELLMLS
jgi:hypothetical protein